MLRRSFLTSILALAAAPVPAAPALAETFGPAPEQIIHDLYQPYVKAGDAAYDLLPAFDAAALMTPEMAVLYRCVTIEPDGNLPFLDWDVFVNGQDFALSGLSVAAEATNGGRTVTARFDNLGTAVTVFYDFSATPEGWRIDDVRYPPSDDGFGAFSLRGFALGLIETPAADPEPADKIRRYYRRQEIWAANMTQDDQLYFTPELDALYNKATQDRNGDVPLIDWDIFVNGQDAQLAHIHVIAWDHEPEDDRQAVCAHFTNMGTLTTVIYDFVKHPQGWRIADVRYPADDELFPKGWSLKAYAAAA